MTTIRIFDDGGKTIDRYTVIIDNDFFTMSANATDHDGFNQYGGKWQGGSTRRFGKVMDLADLPVKVRAAIFDRLDASGFIQFTIVKNA